MAAGDAGENVGNLLKTVCVPLRLLTLSRRFDNRAQTTGLDEDRPGRWADARPKGETEDTSCRRVLGGKSAGVQLFAPLASLVSCRTRAPRLANEPEATRSSGSTVPQVLEVPTYPHFCSRYSSTP